jgi:hypothetical protein
MISPPRVPGTGRLMRSPHAGWVTVGIISILAAPPLPADAAAPEPAVARVALLRGGLRTSVVVDLRDAADQATEVLSLDDLSFSVDIGPVRSRVVAQNLEAARSSPLVREVTLRGIPQPGDTMLVRVEVKAQMPVSGRVRTAGRRVYLDLQPVQAPAGTPAGLNRLSRDSPPQGPLPNPPPDRSWESDLLRRARPLAERPDVMALVRLRAELLQRRGWTEDEAPPGHSRGDQVLAQLDRLLDQARRRQLVIDGRVLRDGQATRR